MPSLGVDGLDALEQAASSHAVRALPGLGARSEAQIIRGVAWARRCREH
ncbi:MAG: hypothetical protein OEN20_07030 [Gammaproteobacteria bacterium]|nr:hypothetical protein [Gammaproteobacteria bacterium]